MWSRPLALALLLLPAPALAGVEEKVAALAPPALVLVTDAEGNELVAQNIDEPFVPASVTKIVTAWLAMEVLGGDYRFETRLYLDAKRVLYVRGGGDRQRSTRDAVNMRVRSGADSVICQCRLNVRFA
jgi:serine-type D-Ala-D-Ala carboxypeptidase/endopeptidase (penicillin-binding protein 4)